MRFVRRKLRGLVRRCLTSGRIALYALLSEAPRVSGRPRRLQPLLLAGEGSIRFGDDVWIGAAGSPNFWTSYCYLESRGPGAVIEIGDRSRLNNGFSAVAEACAIRIGARCLIGHDVVVFDSDFHPLSPQARSSGGVGKQADVIVGDNVFIGSRAVLLKGTRIGAGSVVAAGAVVSGEFPEACLIAGVPARLIRRL